MKYYIYLLTCIISFYVVLGDKSAQEYLSEGSHFLTSGKLNDALIRFDAAIRIEPTNYLSYFKRATAYLSLGRNNAAIDDFTKILNFKPDFDKALLQRARIYITEGKFDLAIQDLSNYLKNNAHDLEAEQWLNIATSSLQYLKQAEDAQKKGNYDECISQATLVSRQSPSLASVRSLRAQCHIAKGEIVEAAGDLARVAQLNPSDFTTFILLTKMNYFALYEPQLALTHIKQCLHYDPEQKQCKQLFKSIKKLDKTITDIENDIESKRFTTAANKLIGTANREGILQQIDLDVDSLEKELGSKIPRKLHSKCYQMACQLYGEQKEKNEDKIHSWCSKALTLDENNKDALIYRGEILLHRKEYDAAVRDLEKANELSEGRDQRVRQLLAQAQQKLKLSKKRDYYKILDVSPTADSREIKKAYRKKAHEWHPDKYSGEMEKEQVESKMAEINQAYEVLSDPDKRQQYDNGFDPYDPEQGQQAPGGGPGGAGNPMGGFPFHFQQGGFQFQNGFPFGGGSFSGRGQQGNRFRGFQQQGGFPGGGFNMHF